MNQFFPQNADGWYVTSVIALRLGDGRQSLLAIDKALAIRPENTIWKIHKTHVLLIVAKTDEANELISELTKHPYNNARIYAELALLLNKLKQYSAAENHYQKAIELTPKDAQLYFNLASIQRYRGDFQQAEVNLNKTIQLNPKDYEAYWLRSSLRKYSALNNHVEELKNLVKDGIKEPVGQAQVCYALAKELEDLQSYPQSFQYLNQGAKARRNNIKYDPNTDLQIINKITQVYDSAFFENQPAGFENDDAIFVLGLPRTGSTLVERIISSHSDVYSAGELNDFAIQMMKQCKKIKSDLPRSRTEIVKMSSQIDFSCLGQEYIQSASPKSDLHMKFIDKLPLNSLNVGLIHLALPKAKIIHVERHPMDTCFAIYKQLFTKGYPFSYDLAELANYYIAHHQLMQHWKKILPDLIYTIRYEDLVNNLEYEAKNLIQYCGLNWQQRCGLYHQNESPAITASAAQVRQPIYQSSVNKWQRYADYLTPLKDRLSFAGICCE